MRHRRAYGPASWLVLLLCLGCGGSGGEPVAPDITGPVDDPTEEPTAGVVRLLNRTPYSMASAYVHVDSVEGERIVRTEIGAGLEGQISDGQLGAGLQVEFDLVLQVPIRQGLRVRRKAKLTVDGDMRVTAELTDATELFSLTIAVGEAEG